MAKQCDGILLLFAIEADQMDVNQKKKKIETKIRWNKADKSICLCIELRYCIIETIVAT